MTPRHRLAPLVLLGLATLSAPALGQTTGYDELLRRVPERANAVLLMDVDGLLDSPIGKREQWRAQAAQAQAKGISFPAGAHRLVMASLVNFASLDQNYNLCLAEMSRPAGDLGSIARRERGFLETLNQMNVVWTPRNLYILAVTPQILGFVTPADRQTIEKGIQTSLIHPRNLNPAYADRAIFRATHKAQIALALDLTNAISPELARQWAGSLPGVDKLKLDTELLGRAFSSAKAVTLSVEVNDTINGELRVEFGNTMDYAKTVAEEAILQILEDFGMHFPDLARWTTTTDGHSITMSGAMNSEGLRRLLSILQPPTTMPESSVPSPAPTAPPSIDTRATATGTPASISKDYFHAVTDLLDGLKKERSNSARGASLWYDRYARQIDGLPILGVDKDLLDWGSTVSRTLREMSSGINYNAKDQTYRIAGLANNTGSYYYGIPNSESKGYNASVVRKQSNAMLDVQIDQSWKALETSVADMRRKLVEKFKVEF